MNKTYTQTVTKIKARCRSKRLRETGSGGGSTSITKSIIEQSSVPGHTHDNKADLDKLSVSNGYLNITDYEKQEDGSEIKKTNKIKAGFADEATNATSWAGHLFDAFWQSITDMFGSLSNKFISKEKDDSTPFSLGVGKDLNVSGKATVGGDVSVSGSHEIGKDNIVHGNQIVDKDNTVSGKSVLKDDVTVGTYSSGLTGSGAKIGKNGNAEMRGLVLWETLQVPQINFNRVVVLVGMDYQSSGGGLIESVTIDKDAKGKELSSGTVKLHLEDGEYGAVKVGDFCMGIFHNFGGVNDTESSDSHTGNITKMGFLTSYFYITEITDASTNGEFKYILREVSDSWTQQNHPSAQMNFAQRGSNTDTSRQSFKYRTTEYSIGLTGVNSWEFTDSNIYYIEGKLDGWSIGDKTFEGYGSVIGNAYIYGKIDQFEKVGYLMTFDGGGDTLLSQGETKTISVIIKDGYGLDVTNLFTDWSIVRNTGNTASDNIWNSQATINNGIFNITWSNSKDDLGGNNLALFTVTAHKGAQKISGTLQI